MKFLEQISEKWNALWSKAAPIFSAIGRFFVQFGEVLRKIWEWIMRLRKIFLTIPVVMLALKLAQENMVRLPETVGMDLQADGTFALQISRELAVIGPFALTIICLLLMFCSKRVLTPWVVSLVTLLLPVFIWVINVFPA